MVSPDCSQLISSLLHCWQLNNKQSECKIQPQLPPSLKQAIEAILTTPAPALAAPVPVAGIAAAAEAKEP